MLGRHGDWQKKESMPEPKTAGKHGDDVPEWAQESNALGDASLTDDSFLGTALPQLTEEERRGLASLSLAPTEAPQPPKTSRFVALEEEETLMPHLSHIGSMLQQVQPTQQQAQPQQAAHMPPVHMPPVHMPPLQMPPQMQQQQVPPVPANVDWLYLDPTGQQQGPFTRQELMDWHQGGFFPNDLPCKPADAPPGAPFMPLIELLKNGWRYRIPIQQPPQQQPQGGLPPWLTQQAQQSAAAQAPRGLSLEDIEQTHGLPKQQAPRSNVLAHFAAGLGISAPTGGAPPQMRGVSLADLESRHMHYQASRQEVASADASAKWDAPPAARDAQPAQPPQPPQPQHSPMPPMPPMPRPPTQPAPRAEVIEPLKSPSGPVWGGASPAPAAASAGKTLLEIQREEEARAAEAAARAPPPSMNTAFGSAWGGGAASVGKSLKEIQEEEARISARRAAEAAAHQQQMGAQLSGGWAAAAASGIPAPKPASASSSIPAPVPRTVPTPLPARTIPSVGNAIAPLTQAAAAPSAVPTGSPPLNDKKALRAWCKVQMMQLNNSDDMTLVDFLLGLPSAGEVQEYVALYLGKTPQASAFAVELIRQKRADPSLAEGLGNGDIAKIAAQGSGDAAGGFDDDDDEGDEGWSSAKKKSGKR